MMKKSLSYLLLISFLSGCTFINQLDKEKIESGVLISYVYSNEIKPRDRADVEITNQTNFCLVFPLLGGIEIYTESNGAQTKIDNLVTYLGEQNLIISPKGEPLSSRTIGIQPDTSKLVSTTPVDFIVKFTGYLCDDKDFKIEKEVPFIAIP